MLTVTSLVSSVQSMSTLKVIAWRNFRNRIYLHFSRSLKMMVCRRKRKRKGGIIMCTESHTVVSYTSNTAVFKDVLSCSPPLAQRTNFNPHLCMCVSNHNPSFFSLFEFCPTVYSSVQQILYTSAPNVATLQPAMIQDCCHVQYVLGFKAVHFV